MYRFKFNIADLHISVGYVIFALKIIKSNEPIDDN